MSFHYPNGQWESAADADKIRTCVQNAGLIRGRRCRKRVDFCLQEEQVLALDLLSKGWRLVYVDEIVAHHHPSSVRDAANRWQGKRGLRDPVHEDLKKQDSRAGVLLYVIAVSDSITCILIRCRIGFPFDFVYHDIHELVDVRIVQPMPAI